MLSSLQAQAATDKDSNKLYLDKNTVYCRAKQFLASYLKFAKAGDMQGLNMMIETGECNFTPDDKKTYIQSYQIDRIDTIEVVAYPLNGKTLWTFKKMLLSDPSSGTNSP